MKRAGVGREKDLIGEECPLRRSPVGGQSDAKSERPSRPTRVLPRVAGASAAAHRGDGADFCVFENLGTGALRGAGEAGEDSAGIDGPT